MSEEEKSAYNFIKEFNAYNQIVGLDIVLNLIDKQQKEIKKLKKQAKLSAEEFRIAIEDSTPNQVIRDKIKEQEELKENNKKYNMADWEDGDVHNEIIWILKELLGE